MRTLEYEGSLYELLFLDTDSALTDGDRIGICMSAVKMNHDKKARSKIRGDNYEGIMRTDGKFYMLGVWGGTKYDTRIETNHGKRDLSVLLIKRINASLN